MAKIDWEEKAEELRESLVEYLIEETGADESLVREILEEEAEMVEFPEGMPEEKRDYWVWEGLWEERDFIAEEISEMREREYPEE